MSDQRLSNEERVRGLENGLIGLIVANADQCETLLTNFADEVYQLLLDGGLQDAYEDTSEEAYMRPYFELEKQYREFIAKKTEGAICSTYSSLIAMELAIRLLGNENINEFAKNQLLQRTIVNPENFHQWFEIYPYITDSIENVEIPYVNVGNAVVQRLLALEGIESPSAKAYATQNLDRYSKANAHLLDQQERGYVSLTTQPIDLSSR